MNDWVAVIAAVGFGSLFVLMLGFGLRMTLQVKASLTRLERKLAGLEKRISVHDEEVKALRAQLEEASHDPVPSIIDSALDWRSRGPLLTGILVGARLFRSYWKGRKVKALPGNKESK
jgi:hypothetical protein